MDQNITKKRYQVVNESQSAHCCFTHTVIDTNRPDMIGDKQYKNQFVSICECFNEEDAQAIADAMNKFAVES